MPPFTFGTSPIPLRARRRSWDREAFVFFPIFRKYGARRGRVFFCRVVVVLVPVVDESSCIFYPSAQVEKEPVESDNVIISEVSVRGIGVEGAAEVSVRDIGVEGATEVSVRDIGVEGATVSVRDIGVEGTFSPSETQQELIYSPAEGGPRGPASQTTETRFGPAILTLAEAERQLEEHWPKLRRVFPTIFE